MSGANALPPLLCSTPPPIDFGEEDEEDSDLPPLSLVDEEDDGDAFGAFALAANAVRSSNDEDNNSDASVNVPSLPHTPIYKDSPPSFEEHCGRSSISPPPLKAPSSCTDTEENMSQKDNHVKEILVNKNVQPIEAFNLNVSLGLNVVSDILTNPSDKDAITNDDKLNLIEPSEADARLTSQKTETLNGTPPAALFTEDVSFGTVINEITRTESDTKTGESCKLTTEDEKITKEANTDDNQAAFDHLAKPVGNRDDIVLLEDIADDSSDDERHSPKKHKSLLIADENSAEFFAIHRIAGAVGDAEELSNNSHLQAKSLAKTHKHEDEVRAAENENKNKEKEKTIENENEDEDDFDDFACFETSATPTIVTKLHAVHPVFSPSSDENANTFEANFSQYPDFTSAPPPPSTADVDQNQPNQNAEWPEAITSAILDADTDDDDFQDFCTAPPEVAQPQAGGTTKSCNDHSDTCDDFGDFSEATFGTLSESHTPHTAPTHLTAASHSSNLNARLRPALEMMFPIAASDGDNEKTTLPKSLQSAAVATISSNGSRFQLGSIDSARALEYHWTNSEVRRALIKSLGIDSRNILFGEKWNSSMPRFAANLGLNPLQPIKPAEIVGATHSTQMHQQLNNTNGVARAGGSVDVPAVDFDWTSSGLVNPLDASHVHTLLLDLDLVVVANLDNINLDSSSCCSSSSPCATLEIQPQKKQQSKSATSKTNPNSNRNDTQQTWLLNDSFDISSSSSPSTFLSAPATRRRPPFGYCNENSNNNITTTHLIHAATTTTHVSTSASNTCTLLSLSLADEQLACNYKNTTNLQHDAIPCTTTPPLCCTTVVSIPNSSTSTATNHHNISSLDCHQFDVNKCLTPPYSPTFAKTTIDHSEKPPPITTTINAAVTIINPFGPSSNNLTIDQNSDCSPKEDVRTREAEASQSGQSTADASTPPPDTTNADPCSEDGEDNANCSSADGAATTTATSSAAATKTLPTIVPADSVGNGIHNNGNDTHLGFHPGGIFECSDRAAAGRRGDADGWDHGRNQINSGNAQEWDNKEAFGFSSGIQVGLDKDVGEENVNDGIDDEVVTTSTFSGPLKETHIYTPSKGEGKTTMTRTGIVQPPTKVSPIDFDYEIAAAGIIIDETVVKKEYRDVEYNPGFGLHFSKTPDVAAQLAVSDIASPSKPSVSEISDVFASIDTGEATSASMVKQLKDLQPAEFDDEFSDFQSVTPTSAAAATTSSSLPIPPPPMTIVGKMKENSAKSRTGTPTFGNQMILSPAILLPQAIAIENSNPKIEWGGDSAVNNIDPEELARIEELFPQPLSKNAAAATKTNDTNKSQRSTPTHNGRKQNHTPSISAAIAHKEQQHSGANDDDDWSDFVSVPAVAVATSNTQPLSHSNNNHLMQAATAAGQQHHHHSPSSSVAQQHNRQQFVTYSPQKLSKAQASLTSSNSNNDDEWSDFVSSAPPPANAPSQFRTNAPPLPQFNSAAWQNANFYNNPLSFYHQSHTSHVPNTNSDVLCQQKFQNNNNNINQYLSNRQQHQPRPQQPPAPQLQPQKIQIMQDFSTAAPSTQHPRFKVNNSSQNVSISSQYQVGSAKVSPSISLIPDLGFVAPTIAHTAFINNLPKPSFQTTKK